MLLRRTVTPIFTACVLYVLNNLSVLSGWLHPPEGYSPTWLPRAMDVAQYEMAARAYLHAILIPNYHAPWLAEQGLFMPMFWILARAWALLHGSFAAWYHIFHFLFYLLAAYALFLALRTFLKTRHEMVAAGLMIFCSIPAKSLAVLPKWIAGGGHLNGRPGISDFLYWTSDGFFHGISGSMLVTFGTATVLLGFSLVGKYLEAGEQRFLRMAGAVVFLSAWFHPFEFALIAGAGSLVLVWRERSIRGACWLMGPAILGVAPYLLVVSTVPWAREVAALNHWYPGSPVRVLLMLGLPTILALTLLIVRPRMGAKTDLLAAAWFSATLVGIYVPWIPHSQHLLNGFHCAAAIVLVRQAAQWPRLDVWRRRFPRLAAAGLGGWLILTLAAYIMYYSTFPDGGRVKPLDIARTVAPSDELAAIEWLRANARSDQLVLAPPDSAPHFAAVPMHSFGSHYVLSIRYEEQRRLATDFFAGTLDAAAAARLLEDYGVTFVIVPQASRAMAFVSGGRLRAGFGNLAIYELGGHVMKRYRGDPVNSAQYSPR